MQFAHHGLSIGLIGNDARRLGLGHLADAQTIVAEHFNGAGHGPHFIAARRVRHFGFIMAIGNRLHRAGNAGDRARNHQADQIAEHAQHKSGDGGHDQRQHQHAVERSLNLGDLFADEQRPRQRSILAHHRMIGSEIAFTLDRLLAKPRIARGERRLHFPRRIKDGALGGFTGGVLERGGVDHQFLGVLVGDVNRRLGAGNARNAIDQNKAAVFKEFISSARFQLVKMGEWG
ncbi:hypothetical protein FQZ97_781770 [compost metagenome]